MGLTKSAKNRIGQIIGADISSGEHGTGTTSPSVLDTDLETGVTSSNKVPSISISEGVITATHLLSSTDSNGNALSEFGLFMNSDGVLLNRLVYPPVNKTASFEFTTIITYKVV